MRNHLRILGLVEGEWTEGPTSWSLAVLVSWVLFYVCVCVLEKKPKVIIWAVSRNGAITVPMKEQAREW